MRINRALMDRATRWYSICVVVLLLLGGLGVTVIDVFGDSLPLDVVNKVFIAAVIFLMPPLLYIIFTLHDNTQLLLEGMHQHHEIETIPRKRLPESLSDLLHNQMAVRVFGPPPIELLQACMSESNIRTVYIYCIVDRSIEPGLRNIVDALCVNRVSVRVFHCSVFRYCSVIAVAGHKERGSRIILIPADADANCVLLSGELASSVENILAPNSLDKLRDSADGIPLFEVFGRSMRLSLARAHDVHYTRVLDLTEGDLLRGNRDICERMSRTLEESGRLLVTHLAHSAQNISVMSTDEFKEWIDINARAIRRGCVIERIIITKDQSIPPDLQSVIDHQISVGIKVYHVSMQEILMEFSDHQVQDFSVYTPQQSSEPTSVIYIQRSPSGGWAELSDVVARQSYDPNVIRRFMGTFEMLLSRAKECQPSVQPPPPS
ncbi:MAG: hypothetical protein KF902_00405 [Phycisphaeraceae bacterium]|nr:hypothetical protein [Phycisphaeraceae bacterium]MCW5768366.1 hypothetical protein [Phycisphaeraceae bacterium]